MIKYSIILRAYNAAGQVSRSIESVIQQSYTNWELIIVNDGSTDDTGVICEEYAAKDKRIIVVHQENKGCLLATQTGVNYATGEYLCLIDSDDWYEREYIEKVNTIFVNHKVDMVVANYNIIGSNNEKQEFCLVEEDCILNTSDAIQKFLETTNYALWNKFVAKERIKYTEEEQRFYNVSGKTTNFGDDLYLLMPVLCGCENIYFTKQHLYNYTIGEQSVSHQNPKKFGEELLVRNRLMEFTYNAIARRKLMNDETEKLIQIDTVVILIQNIVNIMKNRNPDRNVLHELKSNSFYRNIVMRINLSEAKKRLGKKKVIIFTIFNMIVRLS